MSGPICGVGCGIEGCDNAVLHRCGQHQGCSACDALRARVAELEQKVTQIEAACVAAAGAAAGLFTRAGNAEVRGVELEQDNASLRRLSGAALERLQAIERQNYALVDALRPVQEYTDLCGRCIVCGRVAAVCNIDAESCVGAVQRRVLADAEATLRKDAVPDVDADGLESALKRMREAGWAVAVHNDYRLNDEPHTFWLFTHPSGRWVKGEGPTDTSAVGACIRALHEQ